MGWWLAGALLIMLAALVHGTRRAESSRGSWFFGPRFERATADQVIQVLRRPETTLPAELGQHVSVLVWNVQKEQNEAFLRVFPQLAKGRHLLLLQEVHLAAGMQDFFLQSTELAYTMATAFRYSSDGSQAGVALGAAAETLSAEAQVTEDVEPIVGTAKSSLLATFRLPGGRTLAVATVHGINRAPQAAFERQLDNLWGSLKDHSGPLILAGDFNTQSRGKLEYLEALARRLGLVPVAFSPDTRTVSALSRRPLDHAFVRGARVQDAATWDRVGGSDHVAMTFDLYFSES